MLRFLTTAIPLLLPVLLSAQQSVTRKHTLVWEAQPRIQELTDGETRASFRFEGSTFSDETPTIPVFSDRIPLPSNCSASVKLLEVVFEPFPNFTLPENQPIGDEPIPEIFIEQEGLRFWARVRLLPVRKNGSRVERMTAFTLQITYTPVAKAATDRGPFTYNSELSAGTIYKFGVSNSGIYKLDYTFIKNQLGVTNLDNTDPRSIRILGNGGNMLPEKNADPRADDLTENALLLVGADDGRFDPSDYILFYAVGPNPWVYRPSLNDPQLVTRKHLYDNTAWYFLQTGTTSTGIRIGSQEDVISTTYTTNQFDDVQRLEEEQINLLDFAPSATGSGRRWFGDYFFQTRNKVYTFNFPHVLTDQPARLKAEFAGRSGVSQTVLLSTGNKTFSKSIAAVSVSNNEASYAANAILSGSFTPTQEQITLSLDYPPVVQQSEGWLDYIELNVRRKLAFTGNSMEFRDINTIDFQTTTFQLTQADNNLDIWDITNPQVPIRQNFRLENTVAQFGANTAQTLRNFIAFKLDAPFPKPEIIAGKIANQNLHALDKVEMLILYPKEFETQAKLLGEHRKNSGKLQVQTILIDQVYNEFSSGAKDITAIRDFSRMLWERNPESFKYLLLFGDGSFDPKNNTNSTDNKDYIPVYETAESFSPITAYPSDDYFALLSDEEGATIKGGLLDIAVGRLTARNSEDADALVDKIISYENSPAALGDWRLRSLFIADDEDGNPHIDQAEKLANQAAQTENFLNIEKVYFDAYQQIATSAGQRIPDAKAAINSDVFKGMLTMNYIGHGGPRGWGQERVIDNNDIASWDNPNKYPLIITATCSFGGYDDYTNLTGGEQALLKAKSGAVGLFTTVRAVYIDGNERLTDAVQDVIFTRQNGKYLSIGQVLQQAKNAPTVSGEDNARRFTLLGDPAMFLALPEYRVSTTKINGKTYDPQNPDTLKALMPASLEGKISDTQGNLQSGFNGKVIVTIFDKNQSLQTLGQDPSSYIKSFNVQRNPIFKGSATVANGLFKIDFVVPKDINYSFGPGKISYYAENGTSEDAAGADTGFIIGGNANLIKDEQPPIVQAFLNTDAFVFGGITNDDPKILVKCQDDYGMNVTGASIGHDLTAVLDGNVQETFLLNNFYQSTQDDYRSGQAIYPLQNLKTGRHTLAVKGWDVANNPGEGYTEFVVAENGKIALDHVFNYPNPFTTQTYFQFEHNLAGQFMEVHIRIFTVAGKCVKNIFHTAPADGFRVTDISWNGKDEFGDNLAKGVYVYQIQVKGTDLSGQETTAASKFEKLVILK